MAADFWACVHMCCLACLPCWVRYAALQACLLDGLWAWLNGGLVDLLLGSVAQWGTALIAGWLDGCVVGLLVNLLVGMVSDKLRIFLPSEPLTDGAID